MKKIFTLFAFTFFILTKSLTLIALEDADLHLDSELTNEAVTQNEGININNPRSSYFLKSNLGKLVNWNKNLDDYSQLIFPNSYRNAIEGQDAPIDLIQKLHEESFKYWSALGTVSIPEYLNFTQNDFKTLTNLNKDSYLIWNELVACNNGNKEKSRFAIYNAEKNKMCENNEISASLFLKLQELFFNFQSFIMSIKQSEKSPDLIVNSITYTTAYQIIYKNIHPLLSEFAIMNLSIYLTTNNEAFSGITKPITRMSYGLGEEIKIMSDQTYYNMAKNAEPKCGGAKIDLDNLDFNSKYIRYTNFMNTITFLLNLEGLEINLSYKISDLLKIVSKKTEQNCGRYASKLSLNLNMGSLFGVYSAGGIIHRQSKSGAYKAYIGNQWAAQIPDKNVCQIANETGSAVGDVLSFIFTDIPLLNLPYNIFIRPFNGLF